MHSPTLRLFSEEDAAVAPPLVSFHVVRGPAVTDPLRPAIARARQALLGRLQEDGHLADGQPLDPRSLAMLVLGKAFVGQPTPSELRLEVRGLLAAQRADGGWSATDRGPLNPSTSVLAYFALKLAGQSPASEPMVCARRAILSGGGLWNIDQETKLFLALFNQVPYEGIPVPALQCLLAPTWLRSWCGSAGNLRTEPVLLCQAILVALRPRRHVPATLGIRELLIDPLQESCRPGSTVRPFGRLDRWIPLRRPARHAARQALLTVVDRWTEPGAGYQAHLPEVIWLVMALDSLGFTDDTAPRRRAQQFTETLVDREADVPRFRLPVPSSHAEAVIALQASGLTAEHHGLRHAADWLLRQPPNSLADQARQRIVAAQLRRSPPTDDLLPPSLQACHDARDDIEEEAATENLNPDRFRDMLISAQRSNGSWEARRGESEITSTAISLQALALCAADTSGQSMARARCWLAQRQRPDGSWPATEAEGAIAVTSRVLSALLAAGANQTDDSIAAGAAWLLAHQQPGGGWGDAEPGTPTRLAGEGTPTPCTTAAALVGLLAAGYGASEAVARGVDYLLAQQDPDGCWHGSPTPTDFDTGLNTSSLLDTATPLLALSHYAAHYARPTYHALTTRSPAARNRPTPPNLRVVCWSSEAG